MYAKKRRQHHVWKNYLRAWEVDGKVACSMEGRIFETDTINLAVEGDFYKLVKLDTIDIHLIRKFVIDAATLSSAKRTHENLLRRLSEPALFFEANRQFIANIEEAEAALETFRTNALEDLHEGAEHRFQPLLESLYKGNVEFYNDDESVKDFLHYLCMQHMRTKGIKTETICSLQTITGLDLTRTWDIMSQMFSVNIGASLYRERRERKLLLIENRTGVDFITGDQPTLNLCGGQRKPVETLVFYYPLSPVLAVILTETDGRSPVTTERLTCDQVRFLNVQMANAAHCQIYSRTSASLLQVEADLLDLTVLQPGIT